MSQDLSDDPEIKQLFVDESLEALQRVERLLLDAEDGHARADMLDVMFRDMHTIKGTAALLGYDKTASLAHAAEDLMSKLRDKSMIAQPVHFARMVDVVDTLRTLIEATRDQNSEGDLDVGPLVQQLRKDLEGGDAPAPAPVVAAPMPSAPPPPVPSAPAPTTPLQAAPKPSAPAPTVPTSSPVEAAPAPAPTAPPARFEPIHAEAHPEPHEHDEAKEARNNTQDASDGTVRVNVGVLDKLMNLMGELVLARNQMVQVVRAVHDQNAQSAAQRLSIVTSDLQEQIMKTRMQPVARVFEKIPRMIRDLCNQTGKRVATEIDGTTTEIDKALVEAIRDPVTHIIRNAMDHGFEPPDERIAHGKPATGKLGVRAMHEGGMVTIEIRDDGRGIDPAKVKAVAVKRGVISQSEADRMSEREATDLVFRPGFSTAEKVTSISGRGVGMDVVRTHVERAGGTVELESHLGRGTIVRMKMPLTLAIIPALLVQDGGQRFAIPQANLLELVYLDDEQAKTAIEYVRGAPIYRLRGQILPLVRLAPLMRRAPKTENEGVNIVVVSLGQRRYGLMVEQINDTEEIVIKPLHSMLKRLSVYAGATVLGDGGVALILDVSGIAAMAGIELTTSRRVETAEVQELTGGSRPQSMLAFSAGDGAQCAVPVSMVARLEQIEAKNIEVVAGNEVLQYRGEIMPIIRPEAVLSLGSAGPSDTGMQQLIVFNFGRPVGVAVNSIVDVCDVSQGDISTTAPQYALGKAVIFGRTTMLLDVFGLVRQLAPGCIQDSHARTSRKPRVLLADELDALRASLAGFLRASGVEVVEVTHDGMVRELRSQQGRAFDAVVAGLGGSSTDLVKLLKAEQPDLPVVCMSRGDDGLGEAAMSAGARACVKRVEREALLDALTSAGIFQHTESRA
jgi:two-component system chemotaxis sensor kinase CheA